MNSADKRNPAASVRARLLDLAHARGDCMHGIRTCFVYPPPTAQSTNRGQVIPEMPGISVNSIRAGPGSQDTQKFTLSYIF